MTDWTWDARTSRYRGPGGRFLTNAQVLEIQDAWIKAQQAAMRELSSKLNAGSITRRQWQAGMQELIEDAHISNFLLGRGGVNAAKPQDYLRLEDIVNTQLDYLSGFGSDIKDQSPAQILNRSGMYASASKQSLETGKSIASGFTLPRYPGDTNQRCGSNCKCHLSIQETPKEWRIRWVYGAAEHHCPDCIDMASQWNPLVIQKEET